MHTHLLFVQLSLLSSSTGNLLSDAGSLGLDLLDVTNHVEGLLREVVILTIADTLEAINSLLKRAELTEHTSEDLSDLEGLRHETLDLTSALDNNDIIITKLIHTKNGNDILERLVLLKKLLNTTSDIVVLGTNDRRLKHTRGRVEGVDSGVDTELRDSTRKHSSGIKVSEGGSGSRIGKIISRDIDGLDGGNGTLKSGGNTLLKHTEIGSKSGLVTDSGGDTTKKGRHLGTSLSETENVINEEKHILALLITEVLSNSKTGKSNTSTSTRGLVHLTVDKSSLRTGLADLNDTSLNHFTVKIVTLTSTLTDTDEDGVTTMSLSNVVNQLHDEDSLTDTGTTEKTDLTTTSIGGKKIDDLNTSDEKLLLSRELAESRALTVNRILLLVIDRTALIDGLTKDVHDTTESTRADRDHDREAGIVTRLATGKVISKIHGNATDGVVTDVHGNLENKTDIEVLDLKSVENSRNVTLSELDINDGTDNLSDLTGGLGIGTSLELSSLSLTNLLQVTVRLDDEVISILSNILGVKSITDIEVTLSLLNGTSVVSRRLLGDNVITTNLLGSLNKGGAISDNTLGLLVLILRVLRKRSFAILNTGNNRLRSRGGSSSGEATCGLRNYNEGGG
jgi:peptide chain release factor 1